MRISALVLVFVALCSCSGRSQSVAPLLMQRDIELPGVQGKFDHFALDEVGDRLFAAATGNQTVQVIDLTTNKVIQSLGGFGKPHGLAWIAETGRLFVADGGKAELDIFEGSPLKLVKAIKLSEDTDDLIYDSKHGLMYVGHGGTNAANPAAIAIIDAKRLALLGDLPVAAHPEGLEIDPKRQRIFVNISDTGQVAVIDGKSRTIVNTWSLGQSKGNTPLAYDAADDLLLIGCRTPAKLLVLNGKTGKEVASATSDTGADDLFYDPSSHRAYLITGSGSIDSFVLSPEGQLTVLATTHTVSGAKTGLLTPSQKSLYIGIPGVGRDAGVRVYQTSK
jgi:DNA-binding beta-propeller fold protein YncE